MEIRVHIDYPPKDSAKETLLKHLDPHIRLTFGPDLPVPADFDILVCGRPNQDQLRASPNLKTLIIPWAGLPDNTQELLVDFPHIRVHNLHHNAATTAETALALLLSAAKFLLPIDRTFRKNDWTPRYRPSPSIMLSGKTVLILGFGRIGSRVGRVCHALDMRVIGIKRQTADADLPDYPVEIHSMKNLNDLLPRAQVLVITLPNTADTTGLIGARELAQMPRESLLVNVGRGPIVDQFALFKALKDGHLAAAGLDVWYNYPASRDARANTAPADVPFNELENVVMSPHRAGTVREIENLRMLHVAELLNAAACGQSIPNVVDLQRGY